VKTSNKRRKAVDAHILHFEEIGILLLFLLKSSTTNAAGNCG